LQASYGLLVRPQGGELIPLPQLAPDTNGVQRTLTMKLDEQGTLKGGVVESWSGDRANAERDRLHSAAREEDRVKPIESRLAHSLGAFEILKAAVRNNVDPSLPFEWHSTLEADRYAKMTGDLMMVRPRVLGSWTSDVLETKEPRQQPFEFQGPRRDTDNFEIELPPGYELDELTPPVTADYEFASYRSRTELKGQVLHYTRSLEIKELDVPSSRAAALQQLFRVIADDERRSIVLKKTGG
jgi:hypothetical protein